MGQERVTSNPITIVGGSTPLSVISPQSRQSGKPNNPVSTFPGEGHQLGSTKLLADASGPVIAKGAEAGEVVKAGQMIVTVALDDGADAVFDVPASLMRQVSPDVEITVALTDDPKIRAVGRVRETAPQADP